MKLAWTDKAGHALRMSISKLVAFTQVESKKEANQRMLDNDSSRSADIGRAVAAAAGGLLNISPSLPMQSEEKGNYFKILRK